MLAQRHGLLVLLPVSLLTSCVDQPQLALSGGVPAAGPLLLVGCWLAVLSVAVVGLTVFTPTMPRCPLAPLPDAPFQH